MPGRLMSYVYRARPATLSGPSSRFTAVPRTAGFSGHKYLSGMRSAGGCCWPRPPPPCGFSLLRTSHPPCLHRRFHDSCERAAAADVAVEALSRLLRGRIRMPLEQRDGGHYEAWRAEAAHQRVDVAEGLLYRVQRGTAGQAVDRANLLALHLDGERRARVDGPAVHTHRASAARPAVADALVPDQIGPLPQRVEQRDARLDPQIDALAVHHQLDRHVAGPDSARAGAGLSFGFCHAGHRGGEAADAGRLEEVAAGDAGTRWDVGTFVFRSHGLLAPST